MSDLKVGDLVVVVKVMRCCGGSADLGGIYTVTGFHSNAVCGGCGTIAYEPVVLVDGKWQAISIWRVKKIPPLSELETVDRSEEIAAPPVPAKVHT